MPEKKFKYMGCVTDIEFKHALLEQYPNRKAWHEDAKKRREITLRYRDIPELAMQSQKHEARRYYAS